MNQVSSPAGRPSAVRILHLEDNTLDGDLVCEFLQADGIPCQIERVWTREAFGAALKAGGFDLIIADYQLPAFDGFSALAMARAERPDIPFVFVSGALGEELAVEAIRRGATDYAVKQRLDRLPAVVQRALSEARERRAREKAQAALAVSEEQLHRGLLAGRMVTWEFDLASGQLAVSDNAEATLGVPFADVPPDEFLNGEYLESHRRQFQALMRGETDTYDLEFPLAPPDRPQLWLRSQGRAETDATGRVFRVSGVAMDVTARKEAEEALKHLNNTLEIQVRQRTAALEAANEQLRTQIEERETVESTLRQMQRLEAIGQLTSGVAHDFNNLLTVVLGNIGFIERDVKRAGVEGKTLDRLGYVRAAAERGAALTRQLLAFSRRQRLEAKQIDLNEAVSEMRDLLSSSMGGTVRMHVVLGEALWPALVDPTQMELVILNLAINARDAMEVGGQLTVETANVTLGPPSRVGEPPAGDYVMVAVRDTGTGMSPEVLARAFEPFFTTKPTGKGSGLGLAQVYGFARQSGGGVRIETQLGQGTSVMVYLPRADHQDADGSDEVRRRGESARDGLADRRILVVDDDDAVRDVTAMTLRDLGCVVVEAPNGKRALELVDGHADAFDLAVLDFAMPGMNGAELGRALKARNPALPMFFLTGYADLASLSDVKKEHVLEKPFRRSDLALKVADVLSTK